MVTKEIQSAIHWWSAERYGSLNPNIRTVLPFAFQTLDSLYLATRNFPTKWTNSEPMTIQVGGERNLVITLPLSPEGYILVRSVLSFTSDIYFLMEALIKTGNLMELDFAIKELHREADKFREIRNFYTHLNERITNLDAHGISGEHDTKCGIKYTDSSQDNFHLVISDDKIHFSQFKMACEKEIGRNAFNEIFIHARSIYEIVTNHKIHATSYEHPSGVYSTT